MLSLTRIFLSITLAILFYKAYSFSIEEEKSTSYVDSLNYVIENTQNDSVKIITLNKLAISKWGSNNVAYLENIKKIETLCKKKIGQNQLSVNEKKFYLNSLFASLFNQHIYQKLKGDFKTSLSYLNKGLKIAYEAENLSNQGRCLTEIARIYSKLGNAKQALKFLFKGIEKIEKTGDKRLEAYGFNLIGEVYYNLKDNPNQAIKYFSKSLKIHEALNDKAGKIMQLNNIAAAHSQLKNHQKALDYYYKSLILTKKNSDRILVSILFFNISESYLKINNLDSALGYSQKGLNLAKKLNYKVGEIKCLINFGEIFFKQGNLNKAQKYALEGLNEAQKLNFLHEIYSAAELLTHIYEKQNKSKASLKMYKLYTSIKDSINPKQITNALTIQQTKYKLAKEKQQINNLVKEKTIQKKKFIIWIIVAMIILTVLGGVLFTLNKLKTNRYKTELNDLRKLKKETVQNESSSQIKSIQIRRGKKIIPIDFVDVVSFHSENKYTFLTDSEGNQHIVDYTLKALEKTLPNPFIRVHNSFIINKNKILEITKTYNKKVVFVMDNESNTKIPSSVKYSNVVQQIIQDANFV